MSTDSMSFGLMSAARFEVTVPPVPGKSAGPCSLDTVVLSIGWPSTTNSGWLVPYTEVAPRILIDAEAPGSPDWVRTSTLGALPASALTTFAGSVARLMSELSTVLMTEPSRSRVDVVPAPVTTTSPRRSGLVSRVKSRVIVAPLVRTTGCDAGR